VEPPTSPHGWPAEGRGLSVSTQLASQLRFARQCQTEFELRFPLVLGIGEQVPLRDESFDLVISEYGAATWADPHRWIPEAARLLRPGGELVFLH